MVHGRSVPHPPKTYDTLPPAQTRLKSLSNTGNYEEANPSPSPFPPRNAVPERPFTPTNELHLFPIPAPHTPSSSHWQPPLPYAKNPDVVDIDMSEVSPNIPKTQQPQDASPAKQEKESRVIALGGIRRVFRSRYEKAASKQRDVNADDADEESVNSEDEELSAREGRVMRPARPTTNNHYTLNLVPNAPTTKTDFPYTLSGSVVWANLLVRR